MRYFIFSLPPPFPQTNPNPSLSLPYGCRSESIATTISSVVNHRLTTIHLNKISSVRLSTRYFLLTICVPFSFLSMFNVPSLKQNWIAAPTLHLEFYGALFNTAEHISTN